MIDSSRRSVLASGAAAAAASAVPQVFAQAQPAAAVPGLPDGAKVGFYENGNVRIRYAEIGSGFPLLATPGGGLNACMAGLGRGVTNIPGVVRTGARAPVPGGRRQRPVRRDGTSRHRQVVLLRQLHRRPVRYEVDGAGAT